MEFNGLLSLAVLLISCLYVVSGHQCYNISPMPNFDPKQFLGPWYAIQSTEKLPRCMVYDFYTLKLKNTRNARNVNYLDAFMDCRGCKNCKGCMDCRGCRDSTGCINCRDCVGCEGCMDCRGCRNCVGCMDSKNCTVLVGGISCEHCVDCRGCERCNNCKACTNCTDLVDGMGITGYRGSSDDLEAKYRCAGILVVDLTVPSSWTVSSNIPEILAEKMNLTVFDTDYTTHAGVYARQQTPEGYDHSITILSRSKVLDETLKNNLKKYLSDHNIPDDLNFHIVDHNDCDHVYAKFKVNRNVQIDDDDTFYVFFNFIADKDTKPYGCVRVN